MPFVVKDDVVPEDMIKKNERIYKVAMVVIIVIFFLQGLFNSLLSICKWQKCPQVEVLGYAFLLITFIAFLIAIIVGVYLFISVFKIKNFLLNEGIKQERINVKIMVLHTSSFGLFLFAIVLDMIMFILFVEKRWSLINAGPSYFITITITCITSFTSQVIFSVTLC